MTRHAEARTRTAEHDAIHARPAPSIKLQNDMFITCLRPQDVSCAAGKGAGKIQSPELKAAIAEADAIMKAAQVAENHGAATSAATPAATSPSSAPTKSSSSTRAAARGGNRALPSSRSSSPPPWKTGCA